jgi:hypothetical protein
MLQLDLAPEIDALPGQQQQVAGILDSVELIAASINANVAGSNDPVLQNDLSAFLATVAQAQVGAASNPAVIMAQVVHQTTTLIVTG